MKLPASVLPLLVLLLANAHLANAEEALTLHQRFTVGKRYEFGMKMTQESTVAVGGQDVEQKMNMAMKYSMTVTQHDDGKRKRAVFRYGRIAMEANTAGQTLAFDSDKPDDGPAAAPFASLRALVGKEVSMLLDENDKVLDVENFEEVMKEVSSSPAGKMLGQFFNKESMKEMIQGSMLRSLPDHPVKPGESWPLSFNAKMGPMASIAAKGTYTYNKPVEHEGHRCALIGFAATMDMDMDFAKIAGAAAGDDAQAAEAIKKMDLKISDTSMTGNVTFDAELGTARLLEMVTKLKMTMKLPPEANLPDGQSEITIPIKQILALSLLALEDAK